VPGVRRDPSGRPAVANPAVLADPDAAAARMRREARARARFRVAGAVLAGLVVGLGVAVLHRLIRGTPPTVWVMVALGTGVWLALTLQAFRLARADMRGADRPRGATVLRVGPGPCLAVRDSRGAVWQWRHHPTPRRLAVGERGWLMCATADEAPHLVLARPLRPGRHVLWASADRELTRLPDPATDHDTAPEPTGFDDEPYS